MTYSHHKKFEKISDTEYGLRTQIKDLNCELKSYLSNINVNHISQLSIDERSLYEFLNHYLDEMKRLYKSKYNKEVKL
tara:strand:+ start:149 stop:382 length:234 start_codon:yes stop_codon:yes gene_type:complete